MSQMLQRVGTYATRDRTSTDRRPMCVCRPGLVACSEDCVWLRVRKIVNVNVNEHAGRREVPRSMFVASLVTLVSGHGTLVSPLPRNAYDRALPYDQRTPKHPCSCANASGAPCDIGQSCYWYSQGCFIGCPTCDSVSGRRQVDLCGLGYQATLPAEHRTVNRAAPAGSELDIYKHNPWRSPGAAPVVDACGLAGGTPWSRNVSEWGDYVPTPIAQHGSRGSELAPMRSPAAVWRRGATADVTWQVVANHGGGYPQQASNPGLA